MVSFGAEQVFLVTGASSGLGRGVALQLNALGATVVASARDAERLAETRAQAENPDAMHTQVLDLAADPAALPSFVKGVKDKYGKLRGLAHCAGISTRQPLAALDYADLQQLFAIDYFAPVFLAKGFADRRVNAGRGSSMVFVSSAAAVLSHKGMLGYSGAKAALNASIKSVARELAPQGVRANTVSPTDVKTPLVEKMKAEFRVEDLEQQYPMGYGEVDDVASMVVFLLSDRAKWITGQNYVMDCGYI